MSEIESLRAQIQNLQDEKRDILANYEQDRQSMLRILTELGTFTAEHWENSVCVEAIWNLAGEALKVLRGLTPSPATNIIRALEFYADPETYAAIGFLDDPPAGEFMDDFSEFMPELGRKPGKRARIALGLETEDDS